MNTSIAASTAISVKITAFPKPSEDAIVDPEFDLSAGDPDRFPLHFFPPILQALTEEMAKVYQAPPCLVAMSALAVLSGAVGRSVHVSGAFKDKKTRLNLYVLLVGGKGTGKANGSEPLVRPLSDRSRELADRHRSYISDRKAELELLKEEMAKLKRGAVGTDGAERANLIETLKNRQREADNLEAEAKREITLWAADCTSQKLACALADNDESLFSYSSEAGGIFKILFGKYSKGEGDFDLYLQAYSGDALRVDRIGRPSLELQTPCLSLLWLVQGSVLRNLLSNPEAFSRGLTARMITLDTGATRQYDDRLNLEFTQGDTWGAFLNNVLDRRLGDQGPVEIKASLEAREVFAAFHDESKDLEDRFPDLEGEFSRARENSIKIAGLFAVAEGAAMITAECALRAVSVARWCMMNYLGLLQTGRAERLRDRLERLVEVLGEYGREVNVGVLDRRHGFKRPEIDSLVDTFPTRLRVVRVPQSGAGRPAEVVRALDNSDLST